MHHYLGDVAVAGDPLHFGVVLVSVLQLVRILQSVLLARRHLGPIWSWLIWVLKPQMGANIGPFCDVLGV
jgi:hypothetical protein